MLRFWLALSVLLLLGACAPFHRPLAAADRGKVQAVDVRVVVAQESFMFSAQPPGMSAALGGGLVGALIDSSVQQSRQKAMSAEVQAIVGPLLDYDYRVEAAKALDIALAEPTTFPLKVRSSQLLAAMPLKAEQDARIAATRGGPAYLQLLLQYALEPGLGAFTTRTSALLWQDGRSEPSYRTAVIFQTPIGGTAHQAGTLVFGEDPTRSVLDLDCRTHELDNLYVTDASFFPSIGAVNPTLTIIANALRVADRIAARLA